MTSLESCLCLCFACTALATLKPQAGIAPTAAPAPAAVGAPAGSAVTVGCFGSSSSKSFSSFSSLCLCWCLFSCSYYPFDFEARVREHNRLFLHLDVSTLSPWCECTSSRTPSPTVEQCVQRQWLAHSFSGSLWHMVLVAFVQLLLIFSFCSYFLVTLVSG